MIVKSLGSRSAGCRPIIQRPVRPGLGAAILFWGVVLSTPVQGREVLAPRATANVNISVSVAPRYKLSFQSADALTSHAAASMPLCFNSNDAVLPLRVTIGFQSMDPSSPVGETFELTETKQVSMKSRVCIRTGLGRGGETRRALVWAE